MADKTANERRGGVADSDSGPPPSLNAFADDGATIALGDGGQTMVLVCLDPSQVENIGPGYHIVLAGPDLVVGRDGTTCSVHLLCRKLSREHARLFCGPDGSWTIEDLRSTNGVFINGARITSQRLRHGDEVRLGPVPFKVNATLGAGSVEAMAAIAGAGGGGGDDEARTVMLGSVRAGETVLAAAKEKEREKEREKEKEKERDRDKDKTPPRPRRFDAPAPSANKGGQKFFGRFAIGIFVFSLLAAGYVYYQHHQRASAISAAVVSAQRLVRQVEDATRDRGAARNAAELEREIVQLERAITSVERAFLAFDSEPRLANLLAHLDVLRFEREFNQDLIRGRYAEAEAAARRLQDRGETLLARLQKGVQPNEVEDVFAAVGIAKFAGVLPQFRKFGATYTGTPDNPPARGELTDLNAAKSQFVHYRRTYNNALSGRYMVLRDVVVDVDDKDIGLLNEWTDRTGLNR